MIVRVRESARAKTQRIIVGPRRPLEVIVPQRTSDADVDALLEEKRDLVERKVAAAREIAARPPRLGLDQPGVVWLGGEPVPVEHRAGARPVATLRDGWLIVGGSDTDAAGAIERWYRREARRRAEDLMSPAAHGQTGAITLDQSCPPRGRVRAVERHL